jgi:uncharacterized protein (DUF433 family)
MNYRDRITIEPGKRSGKPCIRGMRITVSDVLDYLASGMNEEELLRELPDLEKGTSTRSSRLRRNGSVA